MNIWDLNIFILLIAELGITVFKIGGTVYIIGCAIGD